MRLRCPRKALIVLAGGPFDHDHAREVERSLLEVGVETVYLGRREEPGPIVDAVVREGADSVELCLGRGATSVLLLRALLGELIESGRRHVSIVVHRMA